MMSILVLLNNYFHDFAVAVLVACLLVLALLDRKSRREDWADARDFLQELYLYLRKIMYVAWGFIIVGGIVRTLTYAEFEWSEAAGRGQVAALIVKHILLVSLVIYGVVVQRRLRRRLFSP